MTEYNEQEVLGYIDDTTVAYNAVHRTPDAHAGVHVARMQSDASAMGYEASRAKHLAELVASLGGVPAPAPPPLHVGPGPLSADRAARIVYATATEYPALTRAFGSDDASTDAAVELLRRIIWHLRLGSFQAARQRNPSGLVSADKLCVKLEGDWQAYDVFSLGFAGRALTVQWVPIGGANPVEDAGLPDTP